MWKALDWTFWLPASNVTSVRTTTPTSAVGTGTASRARLAGTADIRRADGEARLSGLGASDKINPVMSMTRALVTSVLLSLGLLTAGASLTTAHAEDPIDISSQITDEAGVLDADQVAVRQALDRFFDRTGLQLFVVYVPTFDDLTGNEWARKTAKKSGLGRADVLLAVATKDRAYGYATDNETFTAQDLETVDRTRILPALRNDDFSGAAIDAADGYGDIAEDDGLPWGIIVLAIVVVLGVGAFLVRRSRTRFDHTHRVLDEHGNLVDPAAILSLEELDDVSSRALVAVDDALLTSNDELRHLEAERGRGQTDGFRFTVDRARSSMREAFTLRQQLDENPTMPEQARRRTNSRIISICEEVDHTLDAQTEAFDALRDWNEQVPHILDGLVGLADELATRQPTDQAGRLARRRAGADRARPQGALRRRAQARGRPRPRGRGSHRASHEAPRRPPRGRLRRARRVHHHPPRRRTSASPHTSVRGRPIPARRRRRRGRAAGRRSAHRRRVRRGGLDGPAEGSRRPPPHAQRRDLGARRDPGQADRPQRTGRYRQPARRLIARWWFR